MLISYNHLVILRRRLDELTAPVTQSEESTVQASNLFSLYLLRTDAIRSSVTLKDTKIRALFFASPY